MKIWTIQGWENTQRNSSWLNLLGNPGYDDTKKVLEKQGCCALRNWIMEFLLWLSELRTWRCLCEDVGLIPSLTQWVKDLVLMHELVQVADVAQIQCCCGCGIGFRCSLDFPSPGTSIYCSYGREKEKKRKKPQNLTFLLSTCTHICTEVTRFKNLSCKTNLMYFKLCPIDDF